MTMRIKTGIPLKAFRWTHFRVETGRYTYDLEMDGYLWSWDKPLFGWF